MKSKKIVFLGLFLSLALILSYVESLIPFFFGVPGMKLGLANAVVLVLLYYYGVKDALFINVLRIVLSSILFGNAFSVVYSLAGGLLSFAVMVLLKKCEKVGIIPISVSGGIFHNIGQLIVAIVIMETGYMVYYLPFLLAAGFVTGLLMGIIANELIKRLPTSLMEE